ncbi:response regulator [Colidextribacter sp. OB.20]|uniref:ATP-binding protein n=1 Tax=Colidextribacter sp. OB.20 TaxID=2304568 RepID=UPI0013682281|nr:ATP-binding protein [Colidextribacter sp. OB.20]NBI11540.1 response regulator [Colidextribacter sp. OB.20]
MVNFVIGLECFAICLTFVALILLLNGDGAREQKLLIFIMCGTLVQNVGYLLELTAPAVEAAVTAVTVENVGSAFVPLCYCWFTYTYCYARPPKRLLCALGIINAFVLPTVFFNWNGLFYREFQWLSTADGFQYISISYGPLYTLFMFTRIIIPYVLSIHTLIRAVRGRSDHQVSRQYWTILGISSLPVVVLAAYVFKLVAVFDLTPLTLAISMSMVAIVVWSRRNYDFRHLAAEKVLESLGDGVIALDDHDRLISYNRAAAHIFTTLPSHKLGENIRVLEDFREEMLNENVPWSFSINGQHYESHSKQIVDDNGRKQGCVILILDMTDIKAYINEIKRVRQQAEKANIAKSEFLANMSHEIRTPMNAIIGLNDIIMEECADPRIYAHAKDVKSAARNLLAIINDILDLSKVEAGKMELVYVDYHLKTVVGEVVGMMDMAASKQGLLLKYECDETLPCRYNGDEGRIKQILINILSNAIKFTKEGHVKVSVTGGPGSREDEELISFRVEDTGCGIREEDLEKIFEDFRQVDSKKNRSVEGTGLGLAIVRHLAELMGGTISVESVYGQGTVVSITIPQRIVDRRPLSEVPEVLQTELEHIETFTAPDVKVLIVDDNVINRKVARGLLKGYAFRLDEAESGLEAIELVRKNRYDIIFMDHMMPVMDGIEAAGIIREDCGENGAAPAIIALTANAMEGMREQFLSRGFQDFIPKPLDRKELGQLLTRWIPEERRQAAGSKEEARSALDPDMFPIEGIDIEAASRYYAGDEVGFANLLELYHMDGQRKAKLLYELARSDIERYCVEVHGLKSASANIGAMEVSDMARAQENAASKGDQAFIERQLPTLLEAYEELLMNIGLFLERRHQNDPREEKRPSLPDQELRERVEAALNELRSFRSQECAGTVEAILRHALPRDVEDSLKEIQGQLRLYEDDNAEALLEQLLRNLEKEEGEA